MAYQNILVDREDGVVIITVNRPNVLNALNDATIGELSAALADIAQDESAKVVVMTGAGDKAFVAGADINELRALKNSIESLRKTSFGGRLMRNIEKLPQPVIMAINGFALGGGTEIALAGDIRIAADTARLGVPEVNLGVFPSYGGTQRLPRVVGKSMAKLLMWTGDQVNAEEALRIGLVDKVVPAAELMTVVKDLAKKIAAKAPVAVRMIKVNVNEGMETDLDRGLAIELANSGITMATEDRVEGMTAFLEKRKPQWKGV